MAELTIEEETLIGMGAVITITGITYGMYLILESSHTFTDWLKIIYIPAFEMLSVILVAMLAVGACTIIGKGIVKMFNKTAKWFK